VRAFEKLQRAMKAEIARRREAQAAALAARAGR